MANEFMPAWLNQAVRRVANRMTTALAGTQEQDLEYGFLMPGCSLSVDAGVGRGHTAVLSATVVGATYGPAPDHLPFDAGLCDPLVGQILSVVATVTAGSLSPTPPPPPLVTVTFFQRSTDSPGVQLGKKTLAIEGVFDANKTCRLDFGILLR
jgi:hypothetical protein